MPTKATDADLLDFDKWVGTPPMEHVRVQPTAGSEKEIVVRAYNVDDRDEITRLTAEKGDYENWDPDEVAVALCTVGIFNAGEVPEQVEINPAFKLTPPQVHKMRKGLLETQWSLLVGALNLASTKVPEATAPFSPRS